jgi:hypothetical protein
MYETDKVAKFLKGINDPKLEMSKVHLRGDAPSRKSFDKCQLFMTTEVLHLRAEGVTPKGPGREISQVDTLEDGKSKFKKNKRKHKDDGKKKDAGRGKQKTGNGGGKLVVKNYPDKEWAKFTDEQKEELRLKRAAKRKAELEARQADSVVTVSDSSHMVGGVGRRGGARGHEEPSDESDHDLKRATNNKTSEDVGSVRKNAGDQFGKAYYKDLRVGSKTQGSRKESIGGDSDKTKATSASGSKPTA